MHIVGSAIFPDFENPCERARVHARAHWGTRARSALKPDRKFRMGSNPAVSIFLFKYIYIRCPRLWRGGARRAFTTQLREISGAAIGEARAKRLRRGEARRAFATGMNIMKRLY